MVRADTSLFALVPPALLGLGAAVFEGISIALLVPLIHGLVERDFAFVSRVPVLSQLASLILDTPIRTDLRTVFFLVSLTFIAASAKLVLRFLSTTATRRQVSRVTGKLRKAIHARYLQFGKLYFDSRNRGQLHQVLTSYVSDVARGLDTLQGAFYAGFTLLVYLVLMAWTSRPLTAIVLLLFPILHLSVGWLVSKTREASTDYRFSFNRLAKNISNALSAIPVIKAYRTEAFERERFVRMSDEVEQSAFVRDSKSLLVVPLQEFVLTSCLLFLLTIVAALVVRDEAESLAAYGVFLLMLRRAGRSLGVFNHVRAGLATASGPLAEVLEVFDDNEKHEIPDGQRQFEGLKSGIQVRGLSFVYPTGMTALRDLEAFFEKGKVTAIVGRSGSGKSTLMHLLMRYYDSSPGTILVDGDDLRDLTLTSWRASIALVAQDTFLFDGSLRANLTYGLDDEISDERLQEVLERSNLIHTVARLPRKLETEVGDQGVKLSGGEKQRVAVARAMLKDSEILLLDEATSALDSKTERSIQEALVELTRDKTTIVVAHRLSTIQHADKIVVLEDGTAVEQGSFAALVSEKTHFLEYCEEQKFNVEAARRGSPS
jgi:subfamily B ATP-binding cassette protein MsbA